MIVCPWKDIKKYANIIVPEGGKNLVALDMIMGRIQRHLEAE